MSVNTRKYRLARRDARFGESLQSDSTARGRHSAHPVFKVEQFVGVLCEQLVVRAALAVRERVAHLEAQERERRHLHDDRCSSSHTGKSRRTFLSSSCIARHMYSEVSTITYASVRRLLSCLAAFRQMEPTQHLS